jgi:hypothetical protein
LGHQMNGTGAMYGFQFISDTGGAIEQAAESSNLDGSRDGVGKLSDYLDWYRHHWRDHWKLCLRWVDHHEGTQNKATVAKTAALRAASADVFTIDIATFLNDDLALPAYPIEDGLAGKTAD